MKLTRATARNLVVAIAVALVTAVPALADQVIPDDLITQSSTCIGFDCVDGESFGFDTLRLKENNLRIHFEDTSTSAGYPANDWRLVANDSGSSGDNYFAIEDSTAARIPFRIEAAAPANAFHLDSNGNVGLGTSSPGLDLSIQTGDTPAMRLEQTNAGGFTAQTWDIAGNEANFFVRDLTGGSRLPFRIRPGAPTSSIDIKANGEATAALRFSDLAKLDALSNVEPVDEADALSKVLDLPISVYNLGGDTSERIGPTAEDFFAAFATGPNEGYVSSGDLAGAGLAAIQGLSSAVDGRIDGIDGSLATLDSSLTGLAGDIGALEGTNATFETSLDDLAQKVADLGNLDALETDVNNLTQKVAILGDTDATLQTGLADLTQQVLTLGDTDATLQTALTQLNQTVGTLEGTDAALKTDLTDLTGTVAILGETDATISAALTKLTERLDGVDDTDAALTTGITKLTDRLGALETAVGELGGTADFTPLQAQIDALEASDATTAATISKLRKKNRALGKRLRRLEKKMHRLAGSS